MGIKQIKKKIIFTDLDETLLKKNKYYYKTLHNFINKLLRHEFLMILLTSKTYSEVINIIKQIKLKIPFSVENGGAYYIPVKDTKDYKYKRILNPRAVNKKVIKKILNENVVKKYSHNIEFIEHLSSSKQMHITKLNLNQLENFNSREYTVPILWHGNKKIKKEFERYLLNYNLKITFGGKLNNISGLHNKLDSMNLFISKYKNKLRTKKLITISLGDSQNDIEILNNSNYSGIIKNNSFKISNLSKKNNIFRSFTEAPHGWVEVIKKILIKLERDNN